MNFLEYLDEQYTTNKKENKIPETNKRYMYYEKIISKDIDEDCQKFELLKIGNKTKILICFKSLRVYLSDLDILNIILKLPENEFNWFIDEFIKICKKQYSIFDFEISSKKFKGIGLPFKESTTKILMHSDNKVAINSFIFIINIILTKDLLGTLKLRRSKDEIKKSKDLLKITIYKYIALLKYYHNENEKITCYLKEIEYPTDEKLNDVFSSYEKTREINKVFQNHKLFEEKALI
ncbi:MAG TPA: hypothetical protein VIK86_01060 [Candidatus Paceibacterota bacterium]